jgi:DNA-binding HxlR family transcriptional regulator
VEYRLTELGISLVDGPLRALAAWVRDHGDELRVPEGADPPLRRSR